MDDLRGQLVDIFRAVFGDPELVVTDATTAADIPGWDSLMHLDLMIAIERHFSITFASAEMSMLKAEGKNVGFLLELIARKLGRGP